MTSMNMARTRQINIVRRNSPAISPGVKSRHSNGARTLCLIILSFFFFISPASAQWMVLAESTNGAPGETAYVDNSEGYRLEIFRDDNVIRSRFILPEGLTRLYQDICPTYQIDNRTAENTSIDSSKCLLEERQAIYNFGAITGNTVQSSILQGLMDGIGISFRFRLSDGDYRETRFTLNGSNRAMTIAIGEEVIVQSR